MAGTAHSWGTIRRKSYQTKTGTTTFYRAVYQNPKATPGHEISKSFSGKREAAAWLEREHRLVEAYWRGDSDWSTPAEREKARKAEAERHRLTFAEYANKFVDEYRTKDGRVLEEASVRKKLEALKQCLGSISSKKTDSESLVNTPSL